MKQPARDELLIRLDESMKTVKKDVGEIKGDMKLLNGRTRKLEEKWWKVGGGAVVIAFLIPLAFAVLG